MLAAVQPRSDGWSGGSYVRAGVPTALSAGKFGSAGTPASAPSGVPTAPVKEARNNQGTNVQIPYTRVVPLHRREAANVEGTAGGAARSIVIDGVPVLEYERLRKGTLAFVLGRRHKVVPIVDPAAIPPFGEADGRQRPPLSDFWAARGQDPARVDPRRNEIDDLNESQRYAHQAHAGVGSGVDRMQRLASVDWVEALFKEKYLFNRIDLHDINLFSDAMQQRTGDLGTLRMLAGSTALYAFDAVHGMATINTENGTAGADAVSVSNGFQKMQGVFVGELGPFLRGMQAGTSPVPLSAVRGVTSATDAPRYIGTNFVFDAIAEELRRRNLMDWTPDGIVCSKLESPSGEPEKSTALDAREAQLFNIGVQGPVLTTTWTSDIRDSKLLCQPLDKVFICLVATLSWTSDNAAMRDAVKDAHDAHRQVVDSAKQLDKLRRNKLPSYANPAALAQHKADVNNAEADLVAKCATAKARADDVTSAARGTDVPELLDLTTKLEEYKNLHVGYSLWSARYETDYQLQLAAKQKDVDDFLAFGTSDADMERAEQVQHDIRTGALMVAKATLSHFRLMRSTSSHMANYSHFVPAKAESRCGLRVAQPKELTPPDPIVQTTGKYTGGGEYIVGAWCVGTVIDSAASRSMVGNNVRTSATGMEINIDVDVSWWSGDKLYQHYMDTSGLVTGRGQKPARQPSSRPPTGPNQLDRANQDVRMTDRNRLGMMPPAEIDASVDTPSVSDRRVSGSRNTPADAALETGGLALRSVRPRRA